MFVRAIFIVIVTLLISTTPVFSQLTVLETDIISDDGAEVEFDSELQLLDYEGGPILLEISWLGNATCPDEPQEALELRNSGFTPDDPSDFADGTLSNVECTDGMVTADLEFTSLHNDEKLGEGHGTAHLFLILQAGEDGGETAESNGENSEPKLIKGGVNVHVRGFIPTECGVELTRLVSCDGGATFGESCVGANALGDIPAEPIFVKYEILNTGILEFSSCELTDGNPGILPGDVIGTFALTDGLPLPGGDAVNVFAGNQACSDELDAEEPSAATVSCLCVVPDGDGGEGEAEDPPEATDIASSDFECETPGLTVTTDCAPQAEMSNDVSVSVTNDTGAALTGCVATATLDEGKCPAGDGNGTPLGLLPSAPFDLPADQTMDLTGMVLGSASNQCATVEVTCNLNGGTITSTADDTCATPGDGCFRAGPGWWMNHPDATAQFFGNGNGVAQADPNGNGFGACGWTWLDEEELYQDLCSNGTDAKENNTSSQQLKLIQKCAVVKLNLAATEENGGNCETVSPAVEEMVEYCCEQVCTGQLDEESEGGLSGPEIGQSGCLGLLGAFNSDGQGGGKIKSSMAAQAMADPSSCKDARGDGIVNPRETLGPPNGPGDELENGSPSRSRSRFAPGNAFGRNKSRGNDTLEGSDGPGQGKGKDKDKSNNGKGKPDKPDKPKGRPDDPGNSNNAGAGTDSDDGA